jgi:hypothetical protein
MLTKALQTLLSNKEFKKGKYTYTVTSVEPEKKADFHGVYYFQVDCSLKDYNQAYALQKMRGDVKQIFEKARMYVGESFTVSYNLLLDGKEPLEIYCPYQTLQKITDRLNKVLGIVDVYGILKIQLVFTPSHRGYSFEGGDSYNFSFYIDLELLSYKGKSLEDTKFSKGDLNIIGCRLEDLFMDMESFRTDGEHILYEELEPDLELNDNPYEDLFYNMSFSFPSINGFEFEHDLTFREFTKEELERLFDSIKNKSNNSGQSF